jgi:Bifunctional DNA primase/polymerase, N-terminal
MSETIPPWEVLSSLNWSPEDRARIEHDHAEYMAAAPIAQQAAIELAAQGYRVFPLHKRDSGWNPETQTYKYKAKTPCLKGGFKVAANTPAEALDLWRLACGDLVGVATGEEADIVVLDLDLTKHPETVGAWLNEHGHKLPDTFVNETQSGGQHWHFRWRPGMGDLRCSSSVLATGVDIRANGGYICAWWRAGCPVLMPEPEGGLPEWPQWLDDLLLAKQQEKGGSASPYPTNVASAPDQLKAANLDVMADIVRQIPNDDFFDGRETWIGFAHAIAGAFADDLNLAEELWLEFCEKREQTDGEPEKVWFDVLSREHTTGAGRIVNIAKHFGIDVSANREALRGAAASRLRAPSPQSVGAAAVDMNAEQASVSILPSDPRIVALLSAVYPVITVQAPIHLMADMAEMALRNMPGLNLMVRGGSLVQPVLEKVDTFKGRTTMAAQFVRVTKAMGMVDLLSRSAQWQKWNNQEKQYTLVNPDRNLGELILARAGKWRLPRTSGIVTIPVFRHDGSLVTEPGLDPATEVFMMSDGSFTGEIPAAPTKEDALKALTKLVGLFEEFPFVSKPDTSAALSALLTPLARTAMDVAPLHAFNATAARTGKTFLAKVCAAMTLGREPPVVSIGESEAETEKRLVGRMIAGSPINVLDNVDGELDGEFLNMLLTNRHVSMRRLGSSDPLSIINATCIYATGNNITPVGALIGKTIECSIDANTQNPEFRTFSGDPLAAVMANRSEYLTAAYTVILAHAQAGFPGIKGIKPLATFGDWDRFIRGALVWLGMADPVDTQQRMQSADPVADKLSGLMLAWKQFIGLGVELTTQRVIHSTMSIELPKTADPNYKGLTLSEAIQKAVPPKARGAIICDARDLGFWFRSIKGKVIAFSRYNEDGQIVGVENLKFVKGKEDAVTKSGTWTVVDAKNYYTDTKS